MKNILAINQLRNKSRKDRGVQVVVGPNLADPDSFTRKRWSCRRTNEGGDTAEPADAVFIRNVSTRTADRFEAPAGCQTRASGVFCNPNQLPANMRPVKYKPNGVILDTNGNAVYFSDITHLALLPDGRVLAAYNG